MGKSNDLYAMQEKVYDGEIMSIKEIERIAWASIETMARDLLERQ